MNLLFGRVKMLLFL